MSKCDDIRERLAEDGPAAAENVIEIERHLESCADCARFAAELERVDRALTELPEHGAQDAPDSLVAETLSAVRAASAAESAAGRPFSVRRTAGLGLAASVVVAAVLSLTLSREWLDSQRQVAVMAPNPKESADTKRDAAKDQFAKNVEAPGSQSLALRENEPAAEESAATTVVGSATETESFETAEPAQTKAELEVARREAEEELNRRVEELRETMGSSAGLDAIAHRETSYRFRSAGRTDEQDAVKESTEIARLLSQREERPSSIVAGAKTKQARDADDAMGNEAGKRQSFGSYADAPARSEQIAASPVPAEPGLSGSGEAVGGLLGDRTSANKSADEEKREYEASLIEGIRKARRESIRSLLESQTAQSQATAFLDRYRSLDGLAFQDPTGYWANSYIPGDPAMRLLQARLKAWDRGAFGSDVRLEERVQPVPQPFDAPQDSALAVYLDADAPAIDGPTRLRLQVGIKGAARQGGHRPAMNIGLLVDLRDGFDAESARRIRALIDALGRARQPEDRFSLTVAGPGGGLLVAPGEFRHGPLRVAMDRMFADPKPAPAIYPDLPSTLAEVSESVRAGDDPNAILGSSLVLLVTGSSLADDLDDLERMAHLNAVSGVPLSVVSLAAREDLAHIDRLVAAGQGNRRILDSAQAADNLIDRELHASSRAVARALRLRIRLAPGVKLVDVLGSNRLDEALAERVREAEVAIDQRLARNLGIQADRGEDEEGIQIVIPNFYAGDSHTILLDVVAENPGPLADVTVRYKDLVYLRNGVARANLTLDDGPRTAGPLELNVLKNLVAWESARRIRQAAAFLREGKPELAAVPLFLLWDLIRGLREEVPGWQSDPSFMADEAMLGEYLRVLDMPAANDTAQRDYLADSLSYAAFRKLQTAAR